MSSPHHKDIVVNRQAFHHFEILDTIEAGICLQGTEVKALRKHSCSLNEAYVRIIEGEIWLVGAHIPVYSHGNIYNHEEKQDRKLLMRKGEIRRLKSQVAEKGITLVPIKLYFIKSLVKITVGLAKGKKLYDKREDSKKKDDERQMRRSIKGDD